MDKKDELWQGRDSKDYGFYESVMGLSVFSGAGARRKREREDIVIAQQSFEQHQREVEEGRIPYDYFTYFSWKWPFIHKIDLYKSDKS